MDFYSTFHSDSFDFCDWIFYFGKVDEIIISRCHAGSFNWCFNHFEVAIATAVILFGLSSGAALATVVGVLIEVPLMLMLVSICKRTCHLFDECHLDYPNCKPVLVSNEI